MAAPGRSEALVYNMDLGATMWDLAGGQPPEDGSARSLAPVLSGQSRDLGREVIISEFWAQFDFYPQAMVHSGRGKFVFNSGEPTSTTTSRATRGSCATGSGSRPFRGASTSSATTCTAGCARSIR